MRIDHELNSRNIKFLFESLERVATCINLKYQPRFQGICIFSSELRWNPRQEMSLTKMSLEPRTREEDDEENRPFQACRTRLKLEYAICDPRATYARPNLAAL